MAYRGADPTAVMGRRIGAYLLDGLLIGIISAIVLVPMTLSKLDTAPQGSIDCSQQEQRDGTGGNRAHYGFCYDTGTDIKFLRSGDAGGLEATFYLLTALEWLAFYVVMQGITGASPGKLLLGLRVVKPDGSIAGMGRCAIRTVLLPVDAACCALVGLITASKSRGHRRVGDMAANTLVIGRDDQQALQLARSGAALPDRRTLAAAQFAESTRPVEATWEERANQIHIPGAPDLPGAATISPAEAGPAPSAAETTWDERRGAYVWFDPESQSWLQHDAVTGQWRPLDT